MTGRSAAATWTATLGQLELQVTKANYDTWLRDTVGLRHEQGRFVVGALNDFATEWLATRMRKLIAAALAGVVGEALEVAFEVARQTPDQPVALLPVDEPDPIPSFLLKQAPLPPALNPALTFEAFVVGEENRLAYESARAVVAQPGAVNPLVIFGESGLGKTHLLSAAGRAAHDDGRAVLFATAERFGNDYVRALGGGLDAFRSRYRGCDVLIVDDVQFLEGKEKFQEEFFHAFNELHAMGKQIIVSADRPPSKLQGLSAALRSRLQWGLVADLQRPAYETRLAILRAKAARHASQLPEDALAAVAERCCPSVRELEGFLHRVIAFAPLVGGHVTRDTVDRALSPFDAPAPGDARPPCPDAIVEAVCRRTGASPHDLSGRSRNREIAYARHLAMYLLREDAGQSVAEICRTFGNRDHSTVLSGIQRIVMELGMRAETAADVRAVRAAVTAAPVAAAG